MEILQRNFLWGGMGEELKFHLVNWDKVCSLLEVRGLGIRCFRQFNQVLLGNWLWRYAEASEHLGKKVIDCKFGME